MLAEVIVEEIVGEVVKDFVEDFVEDSVKDGVVDSVEGSVEGSVEQGTKVSSAPCRRSGSIDFVRSVSVRRCAFLARDQRARDQRVRVDDRDAQGVPLGYRKSIPAPRMPNPRVRNPRVPNLRMPDLRMSTCRATLRRGLKIASVALSICVSWHLFSGIARAGLVIAQFDARAVIDFESTLDGVNEGEFAGAGLDFFPAEGQLNANAWTLDGFSSSADLSRGRSFGGVSTGGLYAFVTNEGEAEENVILGFQPTSTDFTPGTLTLEVNNLTGATVDQWRIDYDAFALNNGGRSSSLQFSYSTDGIDFTSVDEMDFVTRQTEDDDPLWGSEFLAGELTASVAAGDSLYLRWFSDDLGGSGSRDEFGIDNIGIMAQNAPAVPEPNSLVMFGVVGSLAGIVRLWRKRQPNLTGKAG